MPDYLRRPLETLTAGSHGTEHGLQLAEASNARFVLASTSEIYGDPAVHPQSEEYWGSVNSTGPRSVYDEAKRFAEALTIAYGHARGVNVGIIRIFNTYGPRMSITDGRVVTNFVTQALNGDPITILRRWWPDQEFLLRRRFGPGIVRMIDSTEPGPVNLGNPEEFTIGDFAKLVLRITGSSSRIEYRPLPTDDPTRRCPAITRAKERLGWEPEIPVEEGVRRMVAWMRSQYAMSLSLPPFPWRADGKTGGHCGRVVFL